MKVSKRTRLIAIIILLVVGGLAFWKRESLQRAYFNYRVHAVTSRLPDCDRAEVFYLGGDAFESSSAGFPIRPYGDDCYARILDSKTLTGIEVEALAKLWRSQTFGFQYQALCHDPVYAFRFYRGSAMKFETSICFHCSNFYVTALGESGWWGFDTSSKSASNLLVRLQQIFPASIPKTKTKLQTIDSNN